VANLTVEAGNFAPVARSPQDSVKALAFADFYRKMDYDAVGLSSSETAHGFAMWQDLEDQGLPVVAANIFTPPTKKKSFFARIFGGSHEEPVFRQSVIREDHGERLGVIGFVSEKAWKALPDSGAGFIFRSPYEMETLVRRTASHSDHLTVVGEFSQREADSLARRYPEIDLIVSSGIYTEHPITEGKTVIVGSVARGNNGNYVELLPATEDTTANFVNEVKALDGSVPEDTAIAKLLTDAKQRIDEAGRRH